MKNLYFMIIFFCSVFLNYLSAQVRIEKAHKYSNSLVLTVEGGATLGGTDAKDYKVDYLGRGLLEYFLPSNSSSVFGLRVFGGGGYVAGTGLESPLPAYANINEFRTEMFYAGGGAFYSLSLGNVIFPYLFGGVSYIDFNPRDAKGNKMPRNAAGAYETNEVSYMGEGGLRFSLSSNITFNLVYSINFMVSDNLDDIKRKENDVFHSLFAGISYYLISSSDNDNDGDGILDNRDICNDTPLGVKVDEFGCPEDSDSDGIPDYLDECPNTPYNVIVDEKGCEKVKIIAQEIKVAEDAFGKDTVKVIEKELPDKEAAVQKEENEKFVIQDTDRLVLQGTANFEYGKAELLPNPQSGLNKLLNYMIENPQTKWVIVGHTDNKGQNLLNDQLALKRAYSVLNYFTKNGISKDRFSVLSFGSNEPYGDNSTEYGRSLNRRVVIEKKEIFDKRTALLQPFGSDDYVYSQEINIESFIFTDGNLYCIQVSSWQNEQKAQREVEKLKNAGHNAYYILAKPLHKSGSWYRVRIGFFSSLEGAREYQKRIK